MCKCKQLQTLLKNSRFTFSVVDDRFWYQLKFYPIYGVMLSCLFVILYPVDLSVRLNLFINYYSYYYNYFRSEKVKLI